MPFSTVVVGFDASAPARDALALARTLAAGGELIVCCAYAPGALTARVIPPEHGAAGARDAAARLDVARELLGRGAAPVRFEARAARSAAGALHALAEEAGADLVVVGSSHRGRLGRVLPGTTAAQMLAGAPCAVAVAPAGLQERPRWSIERVGAGFDGGAESRRALALAAAVAADHGAALSALAVIEPVQRTFGWAGARLYPEYREDAAAAARAGIDAVLQALDPPPARVAVELLDGDPAPELARASEHLDLLVLGSRAYGPAARLLLGSVSERVSRTAACPLLLWPHGAG